MFPLMPHAHPNPSLNQGRAECLVGCLKRKPSAGHVSKNEQRPHTHTQTHTQAHTHTHACTHTRTRTRMHTRAHTHMHTHTHTHAHMRTRTHKHTHTCTHTHAQTHTYTHYTQRRGSVAVSRGGPRAQVVHEMKRPVLQYTI